MASGTIKTASGWGTPEAVSFPFTPTRDGFVVGYVTPESAGDSYVYLLDNGSSYYRVSGGVSYGSTYGISFPVIAGHTYAIQISGNHKPIAANFIPFK